LSDSLADVAASLGDVAADRTAKRWLMGSAAPLASRRQTCWKALYAADEAFGFQSEGEPPELSRLEHLCEHLSFRPKQHAGMLRIPFGRRNASRQRQCGSKQPALRSRAGSGARAGQQGQESGGHSRPGRSSNLQRSVTPNSRFRSPNNRTNSSSPLKLVCFARLRSVGC
jgi:hypothetical protein